MFGFFFKKPVEPARRVRSPGVQTVTPRAPSAAKSSQTGASQQNSTPTDVSTKEFGGLRFNPAILETTLELSKAVVFFQIVNDKIKLGAHLYSRMAIAQISSGSKACVIFVDKSKCTNDDISAVLKQIKSQGFQITETGVQGFYASSSLVIAMSQGHLNANSLTIERDIARDSAKNSLMSTFVDIVSWAYFNKADDIDFGVDVTKGESQICFKIGGKYVRPERFLLPTDTVIQMLGIAWQKSGGGAAAQFEIKTEQQAQISLDLPKSANIPTGARVRLRWSGMATDRGTCVTMRIQRLGESASIKTLEGAGYLASQMEVLRRVIRSEGGMVILSGVVGSGKSTSIVKLIQMLPRDIKVVSFEDPVELEMPFAYQKTITRDLTSTGPDPAFAAATRALYRSAMDVLYLGEIRDQETGLVARQVGESGHSVYTTTHAKSGLGIVDRLASPAIGIPRDVLATPGILKLLVYQALLPTTCPHCGKSPDDYAHQMGLSGASLDAHQKYFARLYNLYGVDPSRYRLRDENGCHHCIKPELPELNGLSGRTVVSEMIEPDEFMLECIQKGNNIKINNYWRSMASADITDPNLIGKTTMECAVHKAAYGLIDPREIEPRFTSFETVEEQRRFQERSALARHSSSPVRAIG